MKLSGTCGLSHVSDNAIRSKVQQLKESTNSEKWKKRDWQFTWHSRKALTFPEKKERAEPHLLCFVGTLEIDPLLESRPETAPEAVEPAGDAAAEPLPAPCTNGEVCKASRTTICGICDGWSDDDTGRGSSAIWDNSCSRLCNLIGNASGRFLRKKT